MTFPTSGSTFSRAGRRSALASIALLLAGSVPAALFVVPLAKGAVF